jgi:hypothetical protein
LTTATPKFSRQITDHEIDVEQVRETETETEKETEIERETERIKGIFIVSRGRFFFMSFWE